MFGAASKAYSLNSDARLSISSDSPVTESGLKLASTNGNTKSCNGSENEALLKKARILLVEDSFINQKVAKGMLNNLGYLVDVVENGKEALDALENQDYDLVIMDCQMPVMDGYTATEEIRKREQLTHRRTPIIAHTAHAMTYDKDKCLKAGMDDYISKPITQVAMKEIVEKWLVQQTTDETMNETEIKTEEDVLDQSVLEDLFTLEESGQPGLLKELVDYYVDSTPQQIEEIRLAAAEKDCKKLEKLTHALKGSSNSLGLKQLASVCLELEMKGRANSLEGVDNLLSQLEPEFAIGSSALVKVLQTGLSSLSLVA
jgi:CheY-like chemotaxis protein